MVPDGALDADFLAPHAGVPLRLRHLPDERRAVGAAELRRIAGPHARGSPHRRHRDRPEPRLHGPRLYRRAGARLEPASRSSSWSFPRPSTTRLAPKGAHVATLFCQHVAPELPGGRSWDDHRDEVADLMIATVDRYAPGLQGERGRTAGAEPARPRTEVRPHRRRHLRTARCRSTSCSRRGRCSATPIIVGRSRALPSAAPARIPAAASPARPVIMPRTRSSPTGAGATDAGGNSSPPLEHLGATRLPWQHPRNRRRQGPIQ